MKENRSKDIEIQQLQYELSEAKRWNVISKKRLWPFSQTTEIIVLVINENRKEYTVERM
ncbi:MAG: hypothetical protein HS129_00595 [Leptospiraceae bacterium]|nr:hypothetical protein [Leptospiraceae bacterium]